MGLLAQAGEATASATGEVVVFWVFAAVGIGSGIAMILMRNVVHAALMLVLNLVSIAALYLALQSSFLGIIQVIVYAGAIMVLFLFVIMLLGVDRDDLLVDLSRRTAVGASLLAVLVAGGLIFGVSHGFSDASRCGNLRPAEATVQVDDMNCVGLDQALAAADNGSVGLLAERLFNRHTFPFEAAALLLTVATIGALLLGRRRDTDPAGDPAFAPSGPVPDEDDVAAVREDLPDEVEAAIERTGVGPWDEPPLEEEESPPLGEERGGPQRQAGPPMEGASERGLGEPREPSRERNSDGPAMEGTPERREDERSSSEREKE